MVNLDCIPYKLHFATTVIRAPYSFNRTCIESNTSYSQTLTKRASKACNMLLDKHELGW